MKKYTSLKLSKQLSEWGCELESEMIHFNDGKKPTFMKCHKTPLISVEYPAYDILNDIICKYKEDFFKLPTTIDFAILTCMQR